MSDSQKPNSWSRSASQQERPSSRADGDRVGQFDWRLGRLSEVSGDGLFEAATGNPVVRVLTIFAKWRVVFLSLALASMAGAGYCLAAPAGSRMADLPVEWWSIALAAGAMLLALLVTLGAWIRPLESVEDATEVLGVPLVAFEKGGASDVR